MKFKEFMAALDKELKHVYLLSGEETFYIDKAREKILAKLCVSRADLVTLDCSDKIPPADIANAIDSAPLFSPLNVVLVKNAPFFSSEGKFERLENILSNMLETSYVIFIAKSVNKQRKLYKIVSKVGEFLEAEPLRPWQIDDWLNDKLKAIGKNMNFEARKYFAERISVLSEISLWYLDNELSKVALYSGREISVSDLEKNMLEMPEVSNFAVTDAVDARKVKDAVQILRTQLRDRNKAPALTAVLASHVRKLIRAKFFIKAGVKGKPLAEKLEMHPFVAQKFEKTAATYSAKLLEEIFMELADADFKIKSGRADAEILERIVIKLARR
ncbi:MAG: DNA polymerase III subunit delta [Selenomonadaceae bacterium]|nr:DNA polymerase III subunit delta [Selenomonadaceae bacterium]